MNEQEFHPGSVPVAVVARVYGKDASWIRAGIVSGWLPIGKAMRRLYPIAGKDSGKCPVLWAPTFPKVTTSVPSPSSFLFGMALLALRPETTSLL